MFVHPDIYAAYISPARGGDIYVLCVERSEVDFSVPLDPARLTLVNPSGTTVIDVRIEDYEEAGVMTGGASYPNPGMALELIYPDGSRRAHGLRMQYLNVVTIPIFLAHDRPAGTWRLGWADSSSSRSTTIAIDASCSHLPADPTMPSDPLAFAENVDFFRASDAGDGMALASPGSPGFDHCRLVPDVVGSPAAATISALEQYALTNGKNPSVRVVTGSCPDGITDEQGPYAHTVFRGELYRRLMGLTTADDDVFNAAGLDGRTC
jgi:hypothetical protein